MTPKLYLKN